MANTWKSGTLYRKYESLARQSTKARDAYQRAKERTPYDPWSTSEDNARTRKARNRQDQLFKKWQLIAKKADAAYVKAASQPKPNPARAVSLRNFSGRVVKNQDGTVTITGRQKK